MKTSINLSKESKELILETLVFTRLTNSFDVKEIDGHVLVFLKNIILPYRIFILALCRYGLWNVAYSKRDWVMINEELLQLWKEVGIVPTGLTFDGNGYDRNKEPINLLERAVYKNRLTRRTPISLVKHNIKTLDIDQSTIDYFSWADQRAHCEAILYIAEEKYAAIAK